MEDMDQLELEVENKLAYVLAKIYLNIPWKKVGVKSAHKFFIDRIRASSNARNIKDFIDILTKKVNVDFVKIETEYLNFLNKHDDICMMLLRKESLYITNFALETVQLLKEEDCLNGN